MQFSVIGGPMDGEELIFSRKQIPKQVQFLLTGCKASGFRAAQYAYDGKKSFTYQKSTEQAEDIITTIEVESKDWLELEKSKLDKVGGWWKYWTMEF